MRIDVENMDEEELMRLSFMAFAKAKERSEQKGDKKVKVIVRAVDTVNKILPIPLIFQGKYDVENLNMALDNFDNHYDSLMKIVEEKAEKIYLEKKLKEVC